MGFGDDIKKMRAHIAASRVARAAGAMGRGISSAYTAGQRALHEHEDRTRTRAKIKRESQRAQTKNITAETKLINARLRLARAQKKMGESGGGRRGAFGNMTPPFMNDNAWPPDSGRSEAPPGLGFSKSSDDLPLPFGKRKNKKEGQLRW